MIFSKRSLEGYLEINHKESPGFTADQAVSIGLRRIADQVGPGRVAKVPVANCSHCERHVILNPLRTRDRAYCPKCDAYICDQCEGERLRTGVCKPFKQFIDELVDSAAKGRLIVT